MYEPPCLIPSEPSCPNPYVAINWFMGSYDFSLEDETWVFEGWSLNQLFVHLN